MKSYGLVLPPKYIETLGGTVLIIGLFDALQTLLGAVYTYPGGWLTDHWGHLTFAWEASVWSAERCYLKFMKQEMWGVSHFYAIEPNPSRDGHHVHALWCDCRNKSRKILWEKWFDRYGRARIEPVNSRDDVSDYCAKYVTKANAWWGVKLVGQRHPQFMNFRLAGT